MTIEETINQLEDLILDRQTFIVGDDELDEEFHKDIVALNTAVEYLRMLLNEVPTI